MATQFEAVIDDRQVAADLSVAAGNVFRPRAPISTREFFAGRWEQLTTVVDAVAQTGLHIVIFGERGVGKTSLSNIVEPLLDVMEESITVEKHEPRLVVKVNTNHGDSFSAVWDRAFNEVSWVENKPTIGIHPQQVKNRITLANAFGLSASPTIDEVRRTLRALPRSVFIFDEFDRGSAKLKMAFTDLIKSLSDYAVDSTIILVGVSDTIDDLIRDHASIGRAIVQIHLPRMNEPELVQILENAALVLKTRFAQDAAALIVRMSQGLPHYTHLIGLHATREAVNRLSRLIEIADVHRSFDKAITQALQSIREKYICATQSAHKDALHDKIILACAVASSVAKDQLGYFRPTDVCKPLASVLCRTSVTVATFQKHINDFCEDQRGPILEKTGIARAYKYRFNDPLLPPYIFMSAIAEGLVNSQRLTSLTSLS